MTTLNHILAGAAIGLVSPSPEAAFIGGTALHFVLDGIPHVEYDWPPYYFKSYKELGKKKMVLSIIFSVIAAGIILFLMHYQNRELLSYKALFGIIGNIWVDFLDLAMPRLVHYDLLKKPFFKQLHQVHVFFHAKENGLKPSIKLIFTFIVSFLSLIIIYFS